VISKEPKKPVTGASVNRVVLRFVIGGPHFGHGGVIHFASSVIGQNLRVCPMMNCEQSLTVIWTTARAGAIDSVTCANSSLCDGLGMRRTLELIESPSDGSTLPRNVVGDFDPIHCYLVLFPKIFLVAVFCG
jgi:hypothetical protein